MEWIEQVKDTVIKTANAAYGKSEQLVDIAKVKLSIVNAESDVKKLYTELGAVLYEKYKASEAVPEEFSELCMKIDSKQAEISEARGKLAALKNAAICKNCGKEVPENSAFCPSCGNKVGEEVIIIEE